MAKNSTVTTTTHSSSTTQGTSGSQSQGQSSSQQSTQKVVNHELLSQLLQGLADMGYTPRSEEALRQAAENRYNPLYNAEVEAARQKQQQTDLALSQQLDELLSGISRQKDTQNATYDKARANIETGALSRGMGRSSYTMSTLSNNDIARAKALSQIDEDANRQTGQIGAQRTQLSQQLAETLGRLSTDKETNISNYLQELYDQEYQRQMAANQAKNQNYLTAVDLAMGSQSTGVTNSTENTSGWQNQTTNGTDTSTQTTEYWGGSSNGGGSGSGGNGRGGADDIADDIDDTLAKQKNKFGNTWISPAQKNGKNVAVTY